METFWHGVIAFFVSDKYVSVSDKYVSVSDQNVSVSDKYDTISDKYISVNGKYVNVSDKCVSVSDKYEVWGCSAVTFQPQESVEGSCTLELLPQRAQPLHNR